LLLLNELNDDILFKMDKDLIMLEIKKINNIANIIASFYFSYIIFMFGYIFGISFKELNMITVIILIGFFTFSNFYTYL